MTRTYLMLDDQGDRLSRFKDTDQVRLQRCYALADVISMITEVLDSGEELAGAIIDFQLLDDQPERGITLTAEDLGPEADEVLVTTGLGVMLYLRTQCVRIEGVPNDLPLFALTSQGQGHHPLYWSAADLFFQARPLEALTPTDELGKILNHHTPNDPAIHPQPVDDRVAAAADAFELLFDSCCFDGTYPTEAYDWFAALRECQSHHSQAQLTRLMTDRHAGPLRGRKRQNAKKPGAFNDDDYAHKLHRWQGLASEWVRAWGGSTEKWPALPASPPPTPKMWNSYNPLIELFRDGESIVQTSGTAYKTFFTEPDVRAALAYWRSIDHSMENSQP